MRSQLKKLAIKSTIYIGLIFLCVFYIMLCKKGQGIPCFFYSNFHVQCPGCGSTRAFASIVRFDIAQAISYNPIYTLFIYPFAFLLVAQDYVVSILNAVKSKNYESFFGFIWNSLLGNKSAKS